ncbi:MAG: hypothetical protein OXF68_16755 [Gammaproteobacteria bacterium]|nr:hypothetical protein [Gammaproteobacteria bacterium]
MSAVHTVRVETPLVDVTVRVPVPEAPGRLPLLPLDCEREIRDRIVALVECVDRVGAQGRVRGVAK